MGGNIQPPNIRQLIGFAIGARIADITQHDDVDENPYCLLMLDNGGYLKFFSDGVMETGTWA